jgi:hypothetical protein
MLCSPFYNNCLFLPFFVENIFDHKVGPSLVIIEQAFGIFFRFSNSAESVRAVLARFRKFRTIRNA